MTAQDTADVIDYDENFTVISPVVAIPSGANKVTEITVTNKGQIVYDFGNQKIGFKTIEGLFKTDEIDVDDYFDRPNNLEIVFNAEDLKKVLAGFKSSNVVLGFTDDKNYVVIKELGYPLNRRMLVPIKLEED